MFLRPLFTASQCPFYEDPCEKFFLGLSTRKSCSSPEQPVVFISWTLRIFVSSFALAIEKLRTEFVTHL